MGGKLTYEFIRLNLPGSLPNLSMLSASISDNRFKVTEGQFRFDAFRHYMNVVDVQYAFGPFCFYWAAIERWIDLLWS